MRDLAVILGDVVAGAQIVACAVAGFAYLVAGDWKHAGYWLCAAGIGLAVQA